MKIVERDQNIKRLVDENGGYCLCATTKTRYNRCMCDVFRDQKVPGPCRCGRYEKVLEQEDIDCIITTLENKLEDNQSGRLNIPRPLIINTIAALKGVRHG